ncbi:hypothetical protein PoB_002486300 [Plakobranchus ocellatus]|uniref:Uncharacterized protein n=1 Tax=Plakobranchus ocellatus TaxID=259542 RepID=A0AAV3ZU13_9GAST|nr:hypothetical protein PoB_002486300 [Plakobranchus ocellatus]
MFQTSRWSLQTAQRRRTRRRRRNRSIQHTEHHDKRETSSAHTPSHQTRSSVRSGKDYLFNPSHPFLSLPPPPSPSSSPRPPGSLASRDSAV